MDLNDVEEPKNYDFGWWPEIVGAAMVAAVIFLLMVFARGSL